MKVIVEELGEYVCENICKFRETTQTQEEMDMICEECNLEMYLKKIEENGEKVHEKQNQKNGN